MTSIRRGGCHRRVRGGPRWWRHRACARRARRPRRARAPRSPRPGGECAPARRGSGTSTRSTAPPRTRAISSSPVERSGHSRASTGTGRRRSGPPSGDAPFARVHRGGLVLEDPIAGCATAAGSRSGRTPRPGRPRPPRKSQVPQGVPPPEQFWSCREDPVGVLDPPVPAELEREAPPSKCSEFDTEHEAAASRGRSHAVQGDVPAVARAGQLVATPTIRERKPRAADTALVRGPSGP